MNLKGVCRFAFCALILVLFSPFTCFAGTVSTSLTFNTMNENMWTGSGTDAVSYRLFTLDLPINISSKLGSIDTTHVCFPFVGCVNTGSYGAEVDANLQADLGVYSDLTLTAGSVNATVPVNVSLGFPSTVANNTAFNITSSGLFQPGATLSTESPGVNLSMDAYASSQGGSITAEACVVGCVGPATLTINGTPGDATLIQPVFNVSITSALLNKKINLSPYVVAQFGVPYVNTFTQNLTGGSATSPLTLQAQAVGSTPFVSINADVSNIAAALLGFPPVVNGSFQIGTTTVQYTTVQLLAGLGLNATQAFSLSATPEVAYNISYVGSDPQTFMTGPMAIGTPYSLSIPYGDTAAFVTPDYLMMADLTNQTGFVPAFEVGVNLLQFTVGGLKLPYLLSHNFPFPLNSLNVNLFDKTFALGGWNTIQGKTFEIAATGTTPEPASLFLLGTGLLLMAGWLRRRRGIVRAPSPN